MENPPKILTNKGVSDRAPKRPDIRVALDKFLGGGEVRTGGGLVRDHRRRAVLVPEALVDLMRLRAAGRSLAEVGRRIRVQVPGGKVEESVYILPVELTQISRDDPAAAAGVDLPFGTIVNDHGLWVRLAPGWQEIGTDDRGATILRYDAARAKTPEGGPVRGAKNTSVVGRARRLVPRATREELLADRDEAEAWMRLLQSAGGSKTLKIEFKSAGIDCSHVGNVPYLQEAVKWNFCDVRDSEMLRIASLLRNRFRKIRREPPRIRVYSIQGVPRDAAAWNALAKKVDLAGKRARGTPAKIAESRFYDPSTRTVPPGSYFLLGKLQKLGDEIVVVTVNTDWPGEVRASGVHSALMAILSLIDTITAHSAAAVLNKAGTATTFTGATGAGKTTAATFWAERNDRWRRLELRRRYETDLRRTPDAGRMGEAGIQKELDRILSRVGIFCQDDWTAIHKEGAGQWLFWTTERALYARTAGFPGLVHILAQENPLIENAALDLGGSGEVQNLGRVSHAAFQERFFYDRDWGHLLHDRTARPISANVFLERRAEIDPLVRRVNAREAVDWLIQGRGADGAFEPLCNPLADFLSVLSGLGVTGDRLVQAYDRAKQGDFADLGGGDARAGEALFERLDLQVKLWLDYCRETPTFVVNAGAGLEITQDVHWVLSEHPEAFGEWKKVSLAEFQGWMREHYGVGYGPEGEWMHLPLSARRR